MTSAARSPLAPYDAAERWTRRDAAHLVRRTQVGAANAEIDRALAEGPAATIDRLLTLQPESAEFQARNAVLARVAEDSGEIADLRAWWAHRLLSSANPLVEKLTLFWHGHFATSNAKVRSARLMAAQNELFRRHAVGSFSALLHDIARDEAMLVWLDGNANRRRQPNENFARELMELFSLGVGNYAEKDIQEAARAFSGWHVRDGKFWFNQHQHDTGEKTVFGHTGNFDGDGVVELCLQHDAAPRFLATKLLQFFVTPRPEDVAVSELAACIRQNDFALRQVLQTLLASTTFFAAASRHAMIKSPADFVLGTERTLETKSNLRESVALMGQLGQALFEPPTVEGWKGDRLWINSATMLGRANFAAELTLGGRFGEIADPAETAAKFGWQEPRDAVNYYTELLLARDVPTAVPAIERYLNESSGPLGERLRGVLHLLLTLPEYQLM
jgi:uncharacterized protein (DUF1800 family)